MRGELRETRLKEQDMILVSYGVTDMTPPVSSLTRHLLSLSIILESDPTILSQRVSRRESSSADIPLSEQTLSQALQTARDQVVRSLLK